MLEFRNNQRNFARDIALRYLGAASRTVTSVGRLALLGLMISVAVLVIVVSVVNGFEREMRERIMAVLPTIKLYDVDIDDSWDALLGQGGIHGVAPVIEESVLLSAGGKLKAAVATGIEAHTYPRVSRLGEFTVNGDLDALAEAKFGVILGVGLAQELGVGIGDEVRIILPLSSMSAAGPVPRQKNMQIVDLFTSDSQLDQSAVFMSISTAKLLFRTENQIGVHIRLADLFAISPATEAIRESLGDMVRIETWRNSYGTLYQAIAVQKLTMLVLLSFLVGVAAFNLISGLIMIVEQRREDVAILSTFGLQSGSILTVFVLLGSVLALGGITLGILIGAAVANALPYLFTTLSARFELELMSQYFISYLPVDVRLGDLLTISMTALVLALIATIIPARRATQLVPSRVLAHE